MNPRPARNDYRPYKVLLIGNAGSGDCVRLHGAWADADQACDYGITQAPEHFTGKVEVVVIATATRIVVRTATA